MTMATQSSLPQSILYQYDQQSNDHSKPAQHDAHRQCQLTFDAFYLTFDALYLVIYLGRQRLVFGIVALFELPERFVRYHNKALLAFLL